jgi:Tol biopolymer transport system component
VAQIAGRNEILRPGSQLREPRNIGVSPDGKTILFTSEDLTVGDIFLMQAKPTHPKTLRNMGTDEKFPNLFAWCP